MDCPDEQRALEASRRYMRARAAYEKKRAAFKAAVSDTLVASAAEHVLAGVLVPPTLRELHADVLDEVGGQRGDKCLRLDALRRRIGDALAQLERRSAILGRQLAIVDKEVSHHLLTNLRDLAHGQWPRPPYCGAAAYARARRQGAEEAVAAVQAKFDARCAPPPWL